MGRTKPAPFAPWWVKERGRFERQEQRLRTDLAAAVLEVQRLTARNNELEAALAATAVVRGQDDPDDRDVRTPGPAARSTNAARCRASRERKKVDPYWMAIRRAKNRQRLCAVKTRPLLQNVQYTVHSLSVLAEDNMVLQGADGVVLSVPDAILSGVKTDVEGRALELRGWRAVQHFLMSVMTIEDVNATAVINEFPAAPLYKHDHCFDRLAFAHFCRDIMARGHTVQLVNRTPLYVHKGDRIFAGFVPKQLKSTSQITCTQPWISSEWYDPPGWNKPAGRTVRVDMDFEYAFVGPEEQVNWLPDMSHTRERFTA